MSAFTYILFNIGNTFKLIVTKRQLIKIFLILNVINQLFNLIGELFSASSK